MDYHTAQCNKLWYQFQTLDPEDFCRCKHETEFSGSQSLNPIPAGSEAFSDYDSEQEECTQYKIVTKLKSKGNESKTTKCWNLKRDLHKAIPGSGNSVTSRNWLLFAKKWSLKQEVTIIFRQINILLLFPIKYTGSETIWKSLQFLNKRILIKQIWPMRAYVNYTRSYFLTTSLFFTNQLISRGRWCDTANTCRPKSNNLC